MVDVKKIELSPDEVLGATENAHLAILEGLTRSREWTTSKIKFQGGTSLRLVYGSPRFSEDLDFIAPRDFNPEPMIESAKASLLAAMRRIEPTAEVSFKIRRDDKNPRLYNFTIASPAWYRAIKVKVEFWETAEKVINGYKSNLRTVRAVDPNNQASTTFNQVAPVALDTATIEEIFVDKLYAIAGREYVKPRDFFDVWHIRKNLLDPRFSVEQAADLATTAFDNRSNMYPNLFADEVGFAEALERHSQRVLSALSETQGSAQLHQELQRWIPVSMFANIDEILRDAASFANSVAEAVTERHRNAPGL